MKKSHSIARAATASATLAILSACGTSVSQQALAPSSSMPNNLAFRISVQSHGLVPFPGVRAGTHRHETRSWMSPTAKKSNLLYISNPDPTNEIVYVFSYPKGQLVGTLTGFQGAWGECSDSSGDVFVTQLLTPSILEYAHGGTAPIKTLTDPSGFPDGCAVDPMTGNLAVTNFDGLSGFGYAGNVLVYPNATGIPTQYSDPNIYYYNYTGYDNAGNLFVDGSDQSSMTVYLAELVHGGGAFTDLTLNHTLGAGGEVQWDGKFLGVGDVSSQGAASVSRFAISKGKGYLVGSTPLNGLDTVGASNEAWIQGGRVIGPDSTEGIVYFWKYPAGGSPIKAITGLDYPIGATKSKGP